MCACVIHPSAHISTCPTLLSLGPSVSTNLFITPSQSQTRSNPFPFRRRLFHYLYLYGSECSSFSLNTVSFDSPSSVLGIDFFRFKNHRLRFPGSLIDELYSTYSTKSRKESY